MQDTFFTRKILEWYDEQSRPLPWKKIKNPYFIWLSEIILQQTRVVQGLPYYEKFINTYPTIHDLANAPQDEVMKHWQGLGYYARARNMHYTAKHISQKLKGVFPSSYKEIRQLKGIGDYTAAAIASFAFDLPYAVLDGNVARVLTRYCGISTPIDSSLGKKELQNLAQDLLPPDKAAQYNQAIMDFGATQCTPKNPNCHTCPINKKCYAFDHQKINDFPVKEKKIKKKKRYFHFFIIKNKNKIWLEQRTDKDIWQNLYQFPLLEAQKPLDKEEISQELQLLLRKNTFEWSSASIPLKQQLTHQTIIAQFFEIIINDENALVPKGIILVDLDKLTTFAFPRIISRYIEHIVI